MRSSRRMTTWVAALFVLCAIGADTHAEKFEGLVEPYVTVDVSSAVPGLLDEVLVKRGEFVTKDQLLATLESDAERASHELAKARAEFAARRAQRNEELYLKQMISAHEKDELETEMVILQLELRAVEARLEQREIRSPVNAVVVELANSRGEFVGQEPIITLAQIDPLRVEVSVPERLHGKIKVGMKARVEWEAPLRAVRSATVTVVDPVVEAASGTIGIRLELPNPDLKLPAGTKCVVSFPIGG